MANKILVPFLFCLGALLVACSLAFGATVPDPGADPGGFVSAFAGAVSQRAWLLVALLVVIAAVYLFRRFAPWSWAKSDRVGAALALVTGVVTVLAGSLIEGGSFSAQWLLDGVYLGVVAAGGYSVVKKLIWPSDVAQ